MNYQSGMRKDILKESKEERERVKKEAEKMFVRELRKRVQTYFKVCVHELRVNLF